MRSVILVIFKLGISSVLGNVSGCFGLKHLVRTWRIFLQAQIGSCVKQEGQSSSPSMTRTFEMPITRVESNTQMPSSHKTHCNCDH